jgi:hypothetical protein
MRLSDSGWDWLSKWERSSGRLSHWEWAILSEWDGVSLWNGCEASMLTLIRPLLVPGKLYHVNGMETSFSSKLMLVRRSFINKSQSGLLLRVTFLFCAQAVLHTLPCSYFCIVESYSYGFVQSRQSVLRFEPATVAFPGPDAIQSRLGIVLFP